MVSQRGEDIIREVDGERLIGDSPAIQEVLKEIARYASLNVLVILYGETGVGKDLVAQVLHAQSRRRAQPFIRVDCATIPDDLWESECFGSVEGAFTGARKREGLFRQADGGTLFLNELQEVSRRHQAKLKEFLQDQHIRPVGASRALKLDVRLIVATNGNLERMVKEKQFARDFFDRLGCCRIEIPPLRQRCEDIPALVEYFLEHVSGTHQRPAKELTVEAHRQLMEQPWPGNVRQLQNVIEAAWFKSEGSKIEAADIARVLAPWDEPRDSAEANHQPIQALIRAVEAHGLKQAEEANEREMIKYLLATSPSLREAARRAKLSLSALQYKMRKYELEPATPYHTNSR